mgnify:CR=1 FL=1
MPTKITRDLPNSAFSAALLSATVLSMTTAGATLTVDANTTGTVVITAQDAGLTIALPTGSPVEGQKLMIRIKDDGTARSIAYNAIFRSVGITLPTTTVVNKVLYLGCIFNSAETKWDVIAVAQEA